MGESCVVVDNAFQLAVTRRVKPAWMKEDKNSPNSHRTYQCPWGESRHHVI